ncbi:transposase [Streptomyces sp. NPDC048277]|uniref:transposase n=1 Tax=Streptomyces sp. NPDC048277 TaxID=3155027 RepID=UPI0033E2203F
MPKGHCGDAHPGPARCPVRGRGVRRTVSRRWQAGAVPGQLALVLGLQFAENLSDRAADAVRTRIDWKYSLGLELEDPGFDHSVLCEFRARLAEQDGAADRLLHVMLERLTEAGLLKAGGRQRTDAIHVLAAVRRLSYLELVGEALRAALEELAEAAPTWLAPLIEPEWAKNGTGAGWRSGSCRAGRRP